MGPEGVELEVSLETWTWEAPSWVLSRRRAVLAALWGGISRGLVEGVHQWMGFGGGWDHGVSYVSFSKVTVADWVPSGPGATESDVILPLITCEH